MKIAIVGILIIATLGCASRKVARDSDTDALVGVWRQTSESSSAVILRLNNGVFLEKRWQIFDLSKPPAFISSQGKWQLIGGKYIVVHLKTSNEIWRSSIGKPITFEVLKLNSDTFEYLSPDGGVVRECRVGDASENIYHESPLMAEPEE